MKHFILTADDFGLSMDYNRAVLKGYKNGFLKSASLLVNGNAFTDAVDNIIPSCENLKVGCHLNIMEGKSLTKCKLLTDNDGFFDSSYLYILINSYKEEFLKQIEIEFRAQIEKLIKYVKIDHLDSHVHTHAIPTIFELTCKLAKEYNIDYVRTQYEKTYFVPKIKKYFTFKYPINIIKVILLNIFTLNNRNLIKKYDLITNNFVLGVNYTGMMDIDTVKYGLKKLKKDNITVETIIHPCLYKNNICNDQHYNEFLIMINKDLNQKINKMSFSI